MTEFIKNPNPTKDQHFLKDQDVLKKIYESTGIQEGESIIEIGGGEGALTDYLIQGNNYVTVIEKDPYYAAYLKRKYAGINNVCVIEGDALTLDYSEYDRLIANLPYTITEPLMINLAKSGALDYNPMDVKGSNLKSITLLLSQNSVRKMVAPVQITEGAYRHANPEFGLMGAICKSFLDIDIKFAVPSSAFFPEPAVTSFLVNFTPKKEKTTIDRILREVLIDKRGTNPSIGRIYQLMISQGKIYKVGKHKNNFENISSSKVTSDVILNKSIYDLTNLQISQFIQDLVRNDKSIKSKKFNRTRNCEDLDYSRYYVDGRFCYEEAIEDEYDEEEVKQTKYDKKYDYLYDSRIYEVLLHRGLEFLSSEELDALFNYSRSEEKAKQFAL